jgi:hypothetical protein
MAGKRKAARKEPRVLTYTPFTRDEVERIDLWGFARRIRRRSETIRQLVRLGLGSKNRP